MKSGLAANLAFVDEKILPRDVWKVRLGMTIEELQKARPGLSLGDRGLRGKVFSEDIASTTHLYHYLGYTFGKTGLTHFDISSGVWPHSKRQIVATVAWLQETLALPLSPSS